MAKKTKSSKKKKSSKATKRGNRSTQTKPSVKKKRSQTPAKKKKPAKKSNRPKKKMTASRALSIATSDKRSIKQRVAAMAVAPLAVCDKDKTLQAVLKVLRNQGEPIEVRLASLQTLQAASFSTVKFESCRKDYIAALRKVAKDPEERLRQRALGILARAKDGFAQKALMAGLENAKKALLPPEKALQLLSYDVHGEAYSAARKIVKKPPSEIAKREALRLLAADAKSAKLFEKTLRDKNEPTENRQISAAALHSIDPEKLYAHAKTVLLDKSEKDEELQTTCLTALTQFADESTGEDKKLMKRIQYLKGKASRKVKRSANRFLNKYNK